MTKPARPLLTLAEVADRWQVSIKSVRRLIDSRQLGVVRIGKIIRISEEELARFERKNSS